MRPDEFSLDAPLVARLIAGQFPHWADLPLRRVPSAGTDNAMYRLAAVIPGRPAQRLDDRVRTEIRELGADGTIDAGLASAAWASATRPAACCPPGPC
jgi:aminoglycoside phosphotransferase (APT) family kinase protein